MDLVDTHCHIQSAGTQAGERITREKWEKLPNATGETLLQGAVDAGVTRLICVGCDLEDSRLAIGFVHDRQHCWASIGIHPHEAQHYVGQPGRLEEFAELASAKKVVAVGECGLDYYYEHSPKEKQFPVLEYQIELARSHDLPVIFHVRDAFDDFWPIFDKFTGVRGVLHSFTDSASNSWKPMLPS
jgi:TatD DNase family protein